MIIIIIIIHSKLQLIHINSSQQGQFCQKVAPQQQQISNDVHEKECYTVIQSSILLKKLRY